MGLDTVELVMAIEEEFQIEIPDEAAEKMRTPGDICNFVVQTLQTRGKPVDPEQTWLRVRQIVVDQLGVRLDEVTKSADIVRDLRAD